jgi:Zn-dependent peptidase ImmA (M78 family)
MSFILQSLVEKKFPQWNQFVCSEETARELCFEEKVRVVEAQIRARGEYLIYRQVPFIIIKNNLPSKWRAWVLWHELAHHWLHHPGNYKFHKTVIRKFDFEANFVAAIALIPTMLLELMTLEEIAAEFNYPTELLEVRRKIYEYYRI